LRADSCPCSASSARFRFWGRPFTFRKSHFATTCAADAMLSASSRGEDSHRSVFWILRISNAVRHYDSYGFPRHNCSDAGDWCHLSDHWNVAGSQTFSTSGPRFTIKQSENAYPYSRRRLTDCGLRIGDGRILLELDADSAAGSAVLSHCKLRLCRARLERYCARTAAGTLEA
jgi:hypothetical protein